MAVRRKPRAKPSDAEKSDRATRARALIAALGVTQAQFAEEAGLERNNVSAALSGGSAFTSAKWGAGVRKLTGIPEEMVRSYIVDGSLTLSDLLATRSDAALLQADAKDFLESLHSVKGIQAFIDGSETAIPLGDVVGVLAAIRGGAASAYTYPGGRFDLPRLFRDYQRRKLAAGPATGDRSGASRAADEQQSELGGEPPKKVKF